MGPVGGTGEIDVLLVEDDQDLRRGFVEILREARYSTAEAENASEALYLVRSMNVSAVLLDLYLPDHSGLWLLDQLDDPPPVVLITGHDYDLEVMSRQSKVLMYLQKPIKPPDLLAATARAVAANWV
jgi:two-component system, cell cycle response regulator